MDTQTRSEYHTQLANIYEFRQNLPSISQLDGVYFYFYYNVHSAGREGESSSSARIVNATNKNE